MYKLFVSPLVILRLEGSSRMSGEDGGPRERRAMEYDFRARAGTAMPERPITTIILYYIML